MLAAAEREPDVACVVADAVFESRAALCAELPAVCSLLPTALSC